VSLWYFILLGTRLKDIYTTGFISTVDIAITECYIVIEQVTTV